MVALNFLFEVSGPFGMKQKLRVRESDLQLGHVDVFFAWVMKQFQGFWA